MKRQIVLDTETTGLEPKDGHRIIEIGCIEIVDRRITDHHFHCYLNPDRDIDEGAQRVHGISREFLKDHQRFSDIKEALFDYLDGAELVIHNAPFDLGFLDHELKLLDPAALTMRDHCEVIDSLLLARQLHPGQRNNLDALCQRYDIDISNRELHGALKDAQLLARVYLAMTSGQTQMFSAPAEARASTTTTWQIERLPADRKPLPVVAANAAELKAHEDYLEKIK